MTITLLGDDTDAAKKITEFIQSQLEANLPGIKVEVANVPFKTRLARAEKGQFELLANAWSADFSDAISFLDLFTTGNPYNNGKWSNAEYDKLITASKTTDAGNADKRWDDMVKASKLINEEQPIVPLFQLNTPSLLRTNVKGVVHNTAGVSYNWKEAYIAK
ncbi:oligopeptide binding protein [Ligilactobacillus ruminis CAG:367]|nr:oligopeptide binding protein [Ligilactobacillus ruminis CAG:367]